MTDRQALFKIRHIHDEPIDLIEEDNSNSSLHFTIEGDNNNVFVINSNDIPKIKQNIDLVKKIIDEPDEDINIYKKVLISMHKAINTDKKVKDSSYCDDIVKGKAIPTIFDNQDDKQEVLNDPFGNYFLVDIEALKQNDDVKAYRVLQLYNIIPKEENE